MNAIDRNKEKSLAAVFKSNGPEQTIKFGRQLGQLLYAGDIIGLCGDLGSGKTQLVKGIASGLEIDPEDISSPSFILVNEIFSHPRGFHLFHIDLYRLEEDDPFLDEELWEYLEGDGVCAVEWFERLRQNPPQFLHIKISVDSYQQRKLYFTGKGARFSQLVEQLSNFCQDMFMEVL